MNRLESILTHEMPDWFLDLKNHSFGFLLLLPEIAHG